MQTGVDPENVYGKVFLNPEIYEAKARAHEQNVEVISHFFMGCWSKISSLLKKR